MWVKSGSYNVIGLTGLHRQIAIVIMKDDEEEEGSLVFQNKP